MSLISAANAFVARNSRSSSSYQIEQSLRFDGSSRLTRTHSCSQTRTFSFWNKYAFDDANRYLYFHGDGSNYIGTRSGGSPTFNSWQTLNQGSSFTQIYRNGVKFRDPAAWYHFVFKCTSSDVILYINGEQWGNAGGANIALSSKLFEIGSRGNAEFFTGYQAEWHFVDGQELDPTDFGEYDDNGVWRPIEYTGTHGTNGFYLTFDPTATNGIGHDHSGNGNNFTPSGFTTSGTGTDVMSDTPTTNWCTVNPLSQRQYLTTSNGNLQINYNNSGNGVSIIGTHGASSGKWYWETTMTSAAPANFVSVVTSDWDVMGKAGTAYPGSQDNGWSYYNNGQKYHNGGFTAYGNSFTTGDVIGVALDLDNDKIWFSKNGTWQNSGDPAAGTNAAFTNVSGTIFPCWAGYNPGAVHTCNFGQRAFAYTPPTGFKALNTANLPAPTVKDGSKNFDTALYAGSLATAATVGATQDVTGLNTALTPDLVWIKNRGSGRHVIFDVLRLDADGDNALRVDSTDAEAANVRGGVSSLNAGGFTAIAGSDSSDNTGVTCQTGNNYVAWAWAGGGSGSSIAAGSVDGTNPTIASTVSANPTAGFSIVSYTGNATSSQTVGHGLGVAPSLVIVKNRDRVASWLVRHSSLPANQTPLLENTVGYITTNYWESTHPSSTVFTISSNNEVNASGEDLIAYCFAEVEGYSKFGSYSGNGNADGPFCFCGFRPSWILLKSTSSGSWELYDTARDTYNQSEKTLEPNSSAQEGSGYPIDILSNGFKVRTSNSQINYSSYDYIFAAFSEHPFGGSGVSPATAR